ncbi:bifunctional methylenetetrahydrofolate dehydrogenase/methenyltetrahydrofolate cyclohydrolase [Desulfuribacillus stibiiarsenatis]|uniref:Bifunctional protein FolD n=1 Tax=Desulfuribacillus stibiiarsenatis TaxID=1390249 RepID=A0A1E5L6C2_9FIRM|nr:bifunctional methylenetetrahydrofolate dehydrogenase/methenyltetrahydrofolate cyclohydrolase FolD [Desulfuribacillus stibiiarsenatis]OEH85666.1 bifunctional methylenetetrahydrofolate dehydrogenase/methenyltetrahydrofolate cyclohydrolase [Desulfuribacillus stibiiarsenatis]
MATIIDGKRISSEIRESLRKEVELLKSQGMQPGLAVVIVGEDPASQTYVRNKAKACEDIGIYSEKYELDASITQHQLLEKIDELNSDSRIHGILVQLPLPKGIDEQAVIERISAEKDVDGFHILNAGKLLVGQKGFVPCTPAGVIEMIRRTGVSMAGKHVVVIGRSNIVGKPVSILALQENATVTICHSKTNNLHEMVKMADIVIAAVGRPQMITGDMIKDGAIVIDVGINRVDGKLVGDVNYKEAEEKASFITPVPGGVGPMTITMLLQNTVEACKRTNNI